MHFVVVEVARRLGALANRTVSRASIFDQSFRLAGFVVLDPLDDDVGEQFPHSRRIFHAPKITPNRDAHDR